MTTVAGVTMMRNEEDVCVQVVRHLLEQNVDGILVADNLSTDRTRALLIAAFADDDRVIVVDDLEPTYRQGEKMTALAHQAHEIFGADWIVPFDADELWNGPWGMTLAETVARCDAMGADSATADKWEMVPHPTDDGADPDPFSRIRYCQPLPMHGYKTAFRWTERTVVSAGNHTVSTQGLCARRALEVRHYSDRSYAQALAKYKHGASVLPPEWPSGLGAHWRDRGSMDESTFAAWWAATTDPAGLTLWPPERRQEAPGGPEVKAAQAPAGRPGRR